MRVDSESGLTFVEVMVAMFLLSIALVGLAVGFPQSGKAVHTGDRLSTAIYLAQQRLEQMRNRTYTSTTDQITTANFPDENYGAVNNNDLNFLLFRRTVQINDGVPVAACVPPPGTPCTKTVIVRVFYRDTDGTERPVPLTTVFVR